MRICRHFLVSYLALCLAFAGVVGLSPVLHYWIEHGGRGPIHSHGGVVPLDSQQQWALKAEPVQNHDRSPTSPRFADVFVHSYKPFELPKLSLTSLCHSLCHLLEAVGVPESSQRASSNGKGRHDHHSLPQMMVSGCVEQAVDLPLLCFTPGVLLVADVWATSILLPSDWNAQTPSRGPPAA